MLLWQAQRLLALRIGLKSAGNGIHVVETFSAGKGSFKVGARI